MHPYRPEPEMSHDEWCSKYGPMSAGHDCTCPENNTVSHPICKENVWNNGLGMAGDWDICGKPLPCPDGHDHS